MSGVSRRGLLGSGAALGLSAACRRETRTSEPAVRDVGQDPKIGHRLRDGSLREAPTRDLGHVRVLIVGGGVAGLSAAWSLHRAGMRDFVVVDLENEFGGTARGHELERSAHPMGAHYLPAPSRKVIRAMPELVELLEDLGVVIGRSDAGLDLRPSAICAAPLERHFVDGQWFEGLYPAQGQTSDEADQWTRFLDVLRGLDQRDGEGRDHFGLPVGESGAARRDLDGRSMAAWMDERGFDSWRLRWLVDYACRDDFGCTLDQCSAYAGLHHFLARGLEEDRDQTALLTWPSGNGALTRAMGDKSAADERHRRGHLVYAVDAQAGEVRALDLAGERCVKWRADVVLWAAPRFVLSRVLRTPDPAEGALSYSPWLVAGVAVREAPGGLGATLAWDNVPVHDDNLGYVVADHGRSRAEDPGAVLAFYRPLVGDDEALSKHRAELLATSTQAHAANVVAALERMHPSIGRDIESITICRWGHAMVRPAPGFLFGPARARAAEPIGKVLPCASDVAGLPLFEEAFAAGLGAAREAQRRVG